MDISNAGTFAITELPEDAAENSVDQRKKLKFWILKDLANTILPPLIQLGVGGTVLDATH